LEKKKYSAELTRHWQRYKKLLQNKKSSKGSCRFRGFFVLHV